MADSITYFGDPVGATDRNGEPIMVNGRPLLIPENFDLQNEINAAHYSATQPKGPQSWFEGHYSQGSAGDPQRQAGYSGGFDPRYTDAGNYGFALSKAAAGYSVDEAIKQAKRFNAWFGTGKALPKVNENAIRQAYQDYQDGRFLKPDAAKGEIYVGATKARDSENITKTVAGPLSRWLSAKPEPRDVERYALAKWGDLNAPEAKAFMANFEQAFGSYPQHLDLDKLHPLPADGSIPAGKDVSLFVGRNGEVLYYERQPAPGGTGALRGIYGLDGAPGDTKSLPGVVGLDRTPKGSGPPGLASEGSGSSGMMFLRGWDATPGFDPASSCDSRRSDGWGRRHVEGWQQRALVERSDRWIHPLENIAVR